IYNIYDHPKEAESRKDTVLYLMEYHNRITKKQKEEAQNTSLEDNLVKRDSEDRQVSDKSSNPEYDSYVNFVKSELMNNKAFKGKDLGEVLKIGRASCRERE